SISGLLPTSTRPTFSTIRAPSASTDPFSICIPLTSFSVIRFPFRLDVCSSNAMTRRIVTRPGALAPSDAGDDAADGAAAQDQDVVDDAPERAQPRRTNRPDRTNGARQLFHDDEADRDDDAVPNRAASRPDEAGERSPRQQRRERQQALRD